MIFVFFLFPQLTPFCIPLIVFLILLFFFVLLLLRNRRGDRPDTPRSCLLLPRLHSTDRLFAFRNKREERDEGGGKARDRRRGRGRRRRRARKGEGVFGFVFFGFVFVDRSDPIEAGRRRVIEKRPKKHTRRLVYNFLFFIFFWGGVECRRLLLFPPLFFLFLGPFLLLPDCFYLYDQTEKAAVALRSILSPPFLSSLFLSRFPSFLFLSFLPFSFSFSIPFLPFSPFFFGLFCYRLLLFVRLNRESRCCSPFYPLFPLSSLPPSVFSSFLLLFLFLSSLPFIPFSLFFSFCFFLHSAAKQQKARRPHLLCKKKEW